MTEFITTEALTALLQVVLIDLVLAGDNAVVIGLAAAGLPADHRRHRPAHRLCRRRDPASASDRAIARRRRAAALGVLEDVAGAARAVRACERARVQPWRQQRRAWLP